MDQPEIAAWLAERMQSQVPDVVARMERIRNDVTGEPTTLTTTAENLGLQAGELRKAMDAVTECGQLLRKNWEGDAHNRFQAALWDWVELLRPAADLLDWENRWLKLCSTRLKTARSRVVTVIANFRTEAQRIITVVASGQLDGPFWKEWYDNIRNSIGEAERIRAALDTFLSRAQEYRDGRTLPANFADRAGFAEQIRASREQLTRLIKEDERRLPGLADHRQTLERELNEYTRDPNLVTQDLGKNLRDAEATERRLALYKGLLDRQILYFDTHGDGALVELHGKIDEHTKNVAILVPGAAVNQFNMDTAAQRAEELVSASGGDLAMITALVGDHPNNFVNGFSASYAQDVGPALAELSHAVRAENIAQGVGDAKMTVLGYSYGASIVGEAEQAGLTTDRILSVGGAGAGHGVEGPEDLRNPNPKVQRYSMTPLWDPINLAQGFEIANWGHGRDPDDFPGVTSLSPGWYPPDAHGQRQPMEGWAAHFDMWRKDSNAWRNILGVLNSGDIRVSQIETSYGPDGIPVEIRDVGGPPIDIDDRERSKRPGS
jgi:uncharacterized protein YukE